MQQAAEMQPIGNVMTAARIPSNNAACMPFPKSSGTSGGRGTYRTYSPAETPDVMGGVTAPQTKARSKDGAVNRETQTAVTDVRPMSTKTPDPSDNRGIKSRPVVYVPATVTAVSSKAHSAFRGLTRLMSEKVFSQVVAESNIRLDTLSLDRRVDGF
jgi:hypothetical protein